MKPGRAFIALAASVLLPAVLLLAAIVGVITYSAASAQSGGLFSEVDGTPPPSSGVETLASRLVEIDFGQIERVTGPATGPRGSSAGAPSTPRRLVLNLFDDVVFTGLVEHMEPTASGHAMWGRLEGVELGSMTLVVNGGVVAGTVRTPGAVYTIRTAGDGAYVIRQVDESSLPPPGEPLEETSSPGPGLAPRSGGEPRSNDSGPRDDGSEIDVMVVYTPAAKQGEGGRAAMEALIDLYVAETNQAYANSGVVHRIRLVHREEVDYTEEYRGDIARLTNDADGYMDHVHMLRDQYAADLVHLVTVTGYDYCGVAVSATVGDESKGFAITVYSCNARTFAHELGHNMGLRHDRYVEGGGEGSNFGYVNQRAFEPGGPESARWRTIMAYAKQCDDLLAEGECTPIMYFSNPRLTYEGDPMGVPADHPSTGVDGPADAVQNLNANRKTIANYRRSSIPTPRVGLALSPYWLSENGGASTVTATLHRPSRADTVITVSASPADVVTLSANRLIIPAGRTTSADVITITGIDNADRTGDVSVTVSANASGEGVIAPAPVALAVVDDETTPVVTLSLSQAEVVEGEGPAFVTATLDNRSSAETRVVVSASPAEIVEIGGEEGDTLVIPAGQTSASGRPVEIRGMDDGVLTGARNRVTVSGEVENSQGVKGPEGVTLTVIDDEAPVFAEDSAAYTFTAGVAGSRFLEAAHGNGPLTYSVSPAPGNGVIFQAGPPARIGVSAASAAAGPASYTITAADADGDTATMKVTITVRSPVCPGSAAVSGATTGGMVADCEALLAARDTLAGSARLNWSADTHIRKWDGVEIGDRPERVVGLELGYSNQLSGTIPSELGSLTNLRRLYLEDSQLSGPIPPELGSLASLEHLALWGNQLTGEIPADLGSLANLQILALWGNRLTGEIPAELGSLTNLESLDLAYNELSGAIPAELGSLANLRTLLLHRNQLTGPIPASLGGLTNLESLVLAYNELTGPIPASLGGLTNLERLFLRGNRLTGCISESLGNVGDDDLDTLGLPFCGEHVCVTGGAVTDAGNPGLVSDCGVLLAAMDTLAGSAALNWSADRPIAEWDGANLGGTPLRVTGMELSGHGLNGKIPADLGNLSELRALRLQDNQLSGPIPASLGGLTNLEELYLRGNRLMGCIPDELRGVRENDLDGLGLSFCGDHVCVVGGAVTDTGNPGLMSDCEALLAARDTLAGSAALNWSADTPITAWDGVDVWGRPERVTWLDLHENQLTGEIPPGLGNLANLQGLWLLRNQLTGQIPTELGSLANLKYLELWENQLTGQIPTELANLANLQNLSLGGNQLTGQIPTELGGLANLQVLSLRENQLTGKIPTELGNLANLQDLDLGGNQLTGKIPAELGNLANLKDLSLWENQLTGKIPAALGSLAKLQNLSLGGNQLTGKIPAALGSLAKLENLSLGGNQLTGQIPAALGSLANLKYLSLWENQLTGQIPTELGNLTHLQRLWLGGNQLTGCIPDALRNVGDDDPTNDPDHDLDRLGLPFCPPTPLGASSIDSVKSGVESLVISWSPPASGGGLAITAYDLRHIETSADENVNSNWTVVEDAWTTGGGALQYTLTGLTGGTRYDVQVRAVNDVGTGPWSETAAGTPATPVVARVDCGSAVADTSNDALVADCEYLLGMKDELRGSAALNWSADVPIRRWDGVHVAGSPGRVTKIKLQKRGLSGRIPAAIGRLEMLEELWLYTNKLTGAIPAALGGLGNLRWLFVADNDLGGQIPEALNRLTLARLWLQKNDFTGCVPYNLTLTREYKADRGLPACAPPGSATPTPTPTATPTPEPSDRAGLVALYNATSGPNWRNNTNWLSSHPISDWHGVATDSGGRVTTLYLGYNGLSGPIPPELGNLTHLKELWLGDDNDLTGEIPSELSQLTRLEVLDLGYSEVSGAIPGWLGDLSGLRLLYLDNNRFTGEIPPELGSLTRLELLTLHGNRLTGTIPAELVNLSNLESLYLNGNRLTGCVPAGLRDVPNNDFDELGLPFCAAASRRPNDYANTRALTTM